MNPLLLPFTLLSLALACAAPQLHAEDAPDFSTVYRIFDERCVECHAQDEAEGGLVMETFDALMKGGESGKALVPGSSAESLLVKYLRGEVEKDGKKRFMPPGKRKKLLPEDIQLIARWIDAGAKPPLAGLTPQRELKVPKIAPKTQPRNSISALAFSPAQKLVAAGRFQTVELISADTQAVVRKLDGHAGNVNALVFSADGAQLFAASGENGLFGQVKQWNVADGKLVRTIEAHRDTLYALALSPDGATLATGSYDQQIKLWKVATGEELRTLRGHNGAIYALGFRPDGKLLASASADRTVKLWDAATGQRRETLSQPLKELHALAWSPDGQRLAAAGVDNRIRVWQISAEARETTNPLLVARFAHEGAILRLVWSADGQTLASSAQDGTVKLWDAGEIKERLLLEKQPDWPSALALAGDRVVAGRLDGTLAFYDAGSGKPVAPPKAAAAPVKPAPAKLVALDPPGLQRGQTANVKLLGANLRGLKFVSFIDPRLHVQFRDGATAEETLLTVHTPANLPRGSYELAVVGPDAKHAGTVKLHIDGLPQHVSGGRVEQLPASVWGALQKPGESGRIEFSAKAGETLVFDLAAKVIGSKMDPVLSLTDASGKVLASNKSFDGTGDPLIAHTFAADGSYTVVVGDLQFGGSREHFYRLTMGPLPFVTATFPLSVPANRESEVELIGHNLPPSSRVKIPASAPGDVAAPIDGEKFRSRRGFTVRATELPTAVESEPDKAAEGATTVQIPAVIGGRLNGAGGAPPRVVAAAPAATEPAAAEPALIRDEQRRVAQVPVVSPLAPRVPSGTPQPPISGDVDLFRFSAQAGKPLVIETFAARRGSPADTKIEVLHADGKPVERLLLQAVRDSAITFRPIDSASIDCRVDNWEEMGLNQYLYLSGEVVRIFRMPEGPDSGFNFYKINGRRTAYFNTTPTAHSLDEPCYIVEPHPPGTKLISNGLPVFTLYYANDDDGDRKAGIDSRLLFTAPADGEYLVRVSDSRGMSGERFVYELVIREARPDFTVAMDNAAPTLNAGSGQGFTLTADRKDGFDEDIVVEITEAPAGFTVSSPIVIQAGHQEAKGSIFALPGAKQPDEAAVQAMKISASATIAGEKVVRAVNGFSKIALADAPKLRVALQPNAPEDALQQASNRGPAPALDPERPVEITIAPGETLPAWIRIERNGLTTDARFDVENLPHGVIVDNLGLNGITILAGQTAGEIFLKADAWVPEQSRLCFAVSRDAGRQASLPVILHVRKKEQTKTASAP